MVITRPIKDSRLRPSPARASSVTIVFGPLPFHAFPALRTRSSVLPW